MSSPHHAGDIGDHVSLTEPDPTPDEITDPDHPDYVEPFEGATPVSGPGTRHSEQS